jgi:putative ABC transport system permease protein
MFFRLLMESFRRQRRRKMLAGVAILLGTTAVTAMLALATTIGDRIHKELAVYGANIVVYPKADLLDVKVGGVDVKPASGGAYLKESDLEKLKGIFWANNITGMSPELTVQLAVAQQGNEGLFPAKAVGYWFDHDFGGLKTGAPALHPWWKLEGSWPVSSDQVALGSSLAGKLLLRRGDTISVELPELPAEAVENATRMVPRHVEEKFTITGIVSTGDATDSQILLPLETAQTLSRNSDAVSRVDVAARTKPEDAFARKDPDTLSPKDHEIWYCRPYANSIAYQIREAIPAAQAEQVRRVEQNEGNVLNRISGLMWLISAAALLAAGFAVSAAMATAILERRGEIGLMRSLGASKGAIALLFYAETGLLAVFAGSIGYLAGSGLAAWLGARIFRGDGGAAEGVLIPVLLPVVVALALVVAIAGSTPSIRAALRMEPSAILREDA